jgi:dTMP kinase
MSSASPPGLLVVLEGIDGGGKTTLRGALAERVRALGREVVETKEPTDGPIGQAIRALARVGRGTVTPEAELQMFLDDRAEHVRAVVRPALARGAVVLQDRSYFSTIAYQAERGLDPAMIRARCEAIAPRPDVLFVLDLSADDALARITRRGAADDFEQRAVLERLRAVFAGLAEATRLDATQGPDALAEAAWRHLAPRLGA